MLEECGIEVVFPVQSEEVPVNGLAELTCLAPGDLMEEEEESVGEGEVGCDQSYYEYTNVSERCI